MSILIILAILLAPLAAIQVSTILEERRDARRRRLDIFKVLMANRASPDSPENVKALNMIDVEFYGKDEGSKEVIFEWKAFLEHLTDESLDDDEWERKKADLFNQLLYTMANSLGYEFNKVYFQRAAYYPGGDDKDEEKIVAQRKRLAYLFSRDDVSPITVEENHHSDKTDT